MTALASIALSASLAAWAGTTGPHPLEVSTSSCPSLVTVIVVEGVCVFLKTTWTSTNPNCPDPVIVKTKKLSGQTNQQWVIAHEAAVNAEMARCPC